MGRKGAPPVAESSDRSGWAGACVCANNVQRKCLAPTRKSVLSVGTACTHLSVGLEADCSPQGEPRGCLLRQDIRPCRNQKTPSFRMEFSVLALPIFPCRQSIVAAFKNMPVACFSRKKVPTFRLRLSCVGVTYLPVQSPAKYCRRRCA